MSTAEAEELAPSAPTMAQLVKMEQAARVAARRYRGSRMDEDERVQVAWLELLKAHRTFDASVGVDFFPYCLRVAVLALRRANIEARSPVSGCKHRVERMRAVRGVDADDIPFVHGAPSQDRELEDALYRREVRRRVRAVVGREAEAFAFAIGEGEFSPAEIAEHNGIPRWKVYALRKAVREALGNDTELFRLWRERL